MKKKKTSGLQHKRTLLLFGTCLVNGTAREERYLMMQCLFLLSNTCRRFHSMLPYSMQFHAMQVRLLAPFLYYNVLPVSFFIQIVR